MKFLGQKINIYLLLVLLVILSLPVNTHSQSLSLEEKSDIEMSPESPSPNQIVSLELVTSSVEAKSLLVTWYKNGVLEKEGVGKTNHQTRVGPLGKITKITAVITKRDGSTLEKTLNVIPSEIDLVWEADSYTPFFYKGKGLPSYGSEVRIIALPNIFNSAGVRINNDNIIYSWSLNGKYDHEHSGGGNNVYITRGQLIPRDQVISVTAKAFDGQIIGSNLVTIKYGEPEIFIYKISPLTGVRSNSPIQTGIIEGGETTFLAEPFFFSRKAYELGFLEYKWKVDSKTLPNLNKSPRINLGGSSPGNSYVELDISNPIALLQGARSRFNVIIREGQ